MYGCNQARELIDSDSVFRDITLDDTRNQARINFLGCGFPTHIRNQAFAFMAYG